MLTATVQYRDYVFSLAGCPNFGRQVRYEADVPNTPPTRATVTFTVKHQFLEDTFADNQARYRALWEVMQQPSGVLFITDENGTELVNQAVRAETFDLPLQWGQHMAEVTLTFTANEVFDGSSVDATYTPTGGAAIVLPFVIGWRESIRTDRYTTYKANRRESTGSVAASGRQRADPAMSPEERMAHLQGLEGSIKAAMASKDGRLVFGSFSQVIRIDTLDVDIHDGTDYLDWVLSCTYQRLPTVDQAEADFTVSAKDNLEKRERTTSVRGTVKAATRSLAKARADAIVLVYSPGRTFLGLEFDDKQVNGADGADWLELSFSADFRETLSSAATSWKLTVSDKTDLKAGQLVTTYAGTAVAQTTSAALAKARELGDGKYPIRQGSTETVATMSISGDTIFIEVTFSYDYLRKGAWSYAEVSGETDNQTFGLNSTTVSGFAVAATESAAQAFARTFKPTGGLIRSQRESSSTLNASTTTPANAIHSKVDFTYVSHADKTAGSIQYQTRRAIDYKAGEISLSYSGTAWGTTESEADGIISVLISGVTGRKLTDERTSSFDKTAAAYFLSRTFSISWVVPLGSGFFGDDGIVEASYSLEKTFSVDNTVITPIPYGEPYVQTNTGFTPGLIVASGSVTAISNAIAKTWARAKIPTGGYSDPIREKVDTIYVSGSNTSVKYIKFDFTYSKRFAKLDLD